MDTLLQIGLSNALAATLLALAAAAAGQFCRRPALVHSLWLLVLLKLVTPPVRMLPVLPAAAPERPAQADLRPMTPHDLPEIPEAAPFTAADPQPGPVQTGPAQDRLEALPAAKELPPDPSTSAVQSAPVTPGPDWSWKPVLIALWFGGSALWLVVTAVRIRRFQALLRYARAAPEGLRRQVEQLAARLGIRHGPSVWLVPGPISPMLWALGGRARLLLPAALWERLGEDQRTTLLAHELAHYRRRDHWVRALELLATGLYWWHPVVWWGRHELRQAEEECCDAWVVWALPEAARAYATALLETVTFLSDAPAVLPPAVSGVGHVRILKRRLTMIMRATTPRALSWAGCVAVLGLGTLLLPWLPTQAKSEPPLAEKADKADPRTADPPVKVSKRLLAEQVCMTCHVAAHAKEDVVLGRHDEIVRLAQKMEEQRDSVRQAEANLRQAQQRLAETEKRLEAALVRFGHHPADDPTSLPDKPRKEGPKADDFMNQRRMQQLEKKLDELRHEMELLRRQQKVPTFVLPPDQQPALPSDPGQRYKVIPVPPDSGSSMPPTLPDKYQAPTVPLGQAEPAKLLELAEFYQRTGHPGSARMQYEILLKRYPDTKFAEKAAERIKQTLDEKKDKKDGR
ncbi:MAG TPA: M56 family metallopeptidase [Gemmataceae bacterium]|nr:M56 family metallopeptidase [Gemmataceae bacterium]